MARAIPKNFRTITPHLTIEGASDAIKFYKKAFGAKELGRMKAMDGKRLMHAMIMIGNSVVMLNDDFPEWGSKGPRALGGSPVAIHIYVDDADKFFKKALKAGVYLRPLGNTVYCMPPYCIEPDQLQRVYEVMEGVLRGE